MTKRNEQSPVIISLANANTGLYLLETDTHCFLVLAKEFGAGQELVVLAEGDHRFRKLPQIELQQRRHCVHVCITAQTKKTPNKPRIQLESNTVWKRQRDKEGVIKWAYGTWNNNHAEHFSEA